MLMAEATPDDDYVATDDGSRSSKIDSDGEGSPDLPHTQRGRAHSSRHKARQNVAEDAVTASKSRGPVNELDGQVVSDQEEAIQAASHPRQSSKRTASTTQRHRSRRSESKQPSDALLTTEYRKLLNGMIDDAEDHLSHSILPQSFQAGVSLWTSAEKSALFHGISRCGAKNLTLLAQAVPSKSKLEIQAYLSLALEAKSFHTQESTAPSEGTSIAFDISRECEEYLESAADVLATRHEEHEASLQREKFGDQWLIDEDIAEQEDLHYQTLLSTGDEAVDALSQSGTPPPVANGTSSSDVSALLRPAAFLELSRNLFMNNGEHEHLNWHHIEPVADVSAAPAIHRSTLNDLQTIVVNLTRRMVQLCLFQANTRLRAGDSSRSDWTPLAVVREVDVRKALTMSGMNHSWHYYWTHVANRCCVAAYSDSKKYKDGRPGTKIGFRLSAEEVMAELDPSGSSAPRAGNEQQAESLDGYDLGEMKGEDDLLSESYATSADGDTRSQESEEDLKASSVKRRRAPSPDSIERRHDAFLEACDQRASACEEQRMYKALNIEPPSDLQQTTSKHQWPAGRETNPPQARRLAIDYESDWEQALSCPTEESFKSMQVQGSLAQKRRRLLADKVIHRSRPSSRPADD